MRVADDLAVRMVLHHDHKDVVEHGHARGLRLHRQGRERRNDGTGQGAGQ
jgi:hypothetical protein